MSSPGNIPEFLYHTTVTVINNHAASGGSQQAVYVLGTHANLEAAKSFALTALPRINYQPDDFVAYNVHRAGEPWTYGDGVLVSATAPAGQTFIVRIDTKTNNEKLAAAADGTVVLPAGANHLHYVLQTTVDYNKDRSGDCQNTEIEGCFAHKHDAVLAAKKLLSDQKGDFLLYEERSDLAQAHEWPFGENVLVHAIAKTGENYTVAVETAPGAYHKHAKESGSNERVFVKEAALTA